MDNKQKYKKLLKQGIQLIFLSLIMWMLNIGENWWAPLMDSGDIAWSGWLGSFGFFSVNIISLLCLIGGNILIIPWIVFTISIIWTQGRKFEEENQKPVLTNKKTKK